MHSLLNTRTASSCCPSRTGPVLPCCWPFGRGHSRGWSPSKQPISFAAGQHGAGMHPQHAGLMAALHCNKGRHHCCWLCHAALPLAYNNARNAASHGLVRHADDPQHTADLCWVRALLAAQGCTCCSTRRRSSRHSVCPYVLLISTEKTCSSAMCAAMRVRLCLPLPPTPTCTGSRDVRHPGSHALLGAHPDGMA